jgi:hypothetical protein
MFIFRVEHKREICTDSFFGDQGGSLTGHGCQMFSRYDCGDMYSDAPRFGGKGDPPDRIMEHERCAVLAEQFNRWIGYNWVTGSYEFVMPSEWHIVAYGVEDSSAGIDWREDNDQIVFNPEFAVNMGTVTLAEVEAFSTANA